MHTELPNEWQWTMSNILRPTQTSSWLQQQSDGAGARGCLGAWRLAGCVCGLFAGGVWAREVYPRSTPWHQSVPEERTEEDKKKNSCSWCHFGMWWKRYVRGILQELMSWYNSSLGKWAFLLKIIYMNIFYGIILLKTWLKYKVWLCLRCDIIFIHKMEAAQWKRGQFPVWSLQVLLAWGFSNLLTHPKNMQPECKCGCHVPCDWHGKVNWMDSSKIMGTNSVCSLLTQKSQVAFYCPRIPVLGTRRLILGDGSLNIRHIELGAVKKNVLLSCLWALLF